VFIIIVIMKTIICDFKQQQLSMSIVSILRHSFFFFVSLYKNVKQFNYCLFFILILSLLEEEEHRERKKKKRIK